MNLPFQRGIDPVQEAVQPAGFRILKIKREAFAGLLAKRSRHIRGDPDRHLYIAGIVSGFLCNPFRHNIFMVVGLDVNVLFLSHFKEAFYDGERERPAEAGCSRVAGIDFCSVITGQEHAGIPQAVLFGNAAHIINRTAGRQNKYIPARRKIIEGFSCGGRNCFVRRSKCPVKITEKDPGSIRYCVQPVLDLCQQFSGNEEMSVTGAKFQSRLVASVEIRAAGEKQPVFVCKIFDFLRHFRRMVVVIGFDAQKPRGCQP